MPCTDIKYSIYPKCLCNFGFWGFAMLYVEDVLFQETLTFKIVTPLYAEMLKQSQIYKASESQTCMS
jgi:hypothetical protein